MDRRVRRRQKDGVAQVGKRTKAYANARLAICMFILLVQVSVRLVFVAGDGEAPPRGPKALNCVEVALRSNFLNSLEVSVFTHFSIIIPASDGE